MNLFKLVNPQTYITKGMGYKYFFMVFVRALYTVIIHYDVHIHDDRLAIIKNGKLDNKAVS